MHLGLDQRVLTDSDSHPTPRASPMDSASDSARTAQYHTPEQIEGKPHDRAVDYWAVV